MDLMIKNKISSKTAVKAKSHNYYRISVDGKGSVDRFGNLTNDRGLTHIDIGSNSYQDIINVIDKFIKR